MLTVKIEGAGRELLAQQIAEMLEIKFGVFAFIDGCARPTYNRDLQTFYCTGDFLPDGIFNDVRIETVQGE